MGLARNVISDYYRVKRNTQEVATDFEAAPAIANQAAVDNFREVDEQMVLQSLFSQLEARYSQDSPIGKLVIAVQEMIKDGIDCNDYAEITRRTGISDKSVRVYFHRMAKAAQALLADEKDG